MWASWSERIVRNVVLYVVGIVGEVHEDGVSEDVGVLGRMDPYEVLVLDEG
jgi:hypothetical protein